MWIPDVCLYVYRGAYLQVYMFSRAITENTQNVLVPGTTFMRKYEKVTVSERLHNIDELCPGSICHMLSSVSPSFCVEEQCFTQIETLWREMSTELPPKFASPWHKFLQWNGDFCV